MSLSTPLDSLDSSEPTADEERVKRILAEMNPDTSRIITEKPNTTSIGDLRMDPGPSRAHMIGNATPSMADFQSMLFQTPPGMTPIHKNEQPEAPVRKEKPVQQPSVWSIVLQQLRAPLIVVGIVFLLNLPVITNMMSRYASWMYLGSGEISISGLAVKSLLGGALFAFYQIIQSFLKTEY
jgi:hypothetical protein